MPMTPIEQAEEMIEQRLRDFLDCDDEIVADIRRAILSALTTAPEPIRAALADALVPWQPIEEAKKDGTRYLLLRDAFEDHPGGATLGYWDAPEHGEYLGDCGVECRCPEYGEPPAPMWWSEDGGFTEEHPPAGFKPLPAPPKKEG